MLTCCSWQVASVGGCSDILLGPSVVKQMHDAATHSATDITALAADEDALALELLVRMPKDSAKASA